MKNDTESIITLLRVLLIIGIGAFPVILNISAIPAARLYMHRHLTVRNSLENILLQGGGNLMGLLDGNVLGHNQVYVHKLFATG